MPDLAKDTSGASDEAPPPAKKSRDGHKKMTEKAATRKAAAARRKAAQLAKAINEEEAAADHEFSVSIGHGGHHLDIEKYLPLADSFLKSHIASLVLSAANAAVFFTRCHLQGVVRTKANTSQYLNKKMMHHLE